MRIVVDAVAVQGGGGRTYLLNIMEALTAATPKHDYLVVLTSRQRDMAGLLPPGVRTLVCESAPASPWLRIAWEQFALPRIVARERADLLLAGFNTSPLLPRVPVVLVAHSVNAYSELPIAWPFPMVARHAALRWLGRRSAAVASRVVFVSRTAADFMGPRMGVLPEHVRVIPYGWRRPDPSAGDVEGVPPLPQRYVLTVGDLLEHKNVETLLEGFDILVSETRYGGDLVIVGREDGASRRYAARLGQVRRRLGHPDRVHFVGAVPPTAVPHVYAGAEIFVLPSLEETFGLPLVEAMGAGLPVVASDWRLNPAGDSGRTNVGPEICGDAAEFFDPVSPRGLADAMRRVIETPARRTTLAGAGPPRAARFTWTRTAAGLLQVFDEVVTGSSPRPGAHPPGGRLSIGGNPEPREF